MLQRSLLAIALTSLAALAAATPADAGHWRPCGLRCVLDPTDDAAIYMVVNRRFTHRLYDPTETVRNYPRFTRRLLDPTDEAAPYMVHRRLRQPPRRAPLSGPADWGDDAALNGSRATSALARYDRGLDNRGFGNALSVRPHSHPPVSSGRAVHRTPR